MGKGDVWTMLSEAVRRGETAWLILLAAGEGSGPNRPGAKMAVLAGNACVGTVGGGLPEYKLVQRVRTLQPEGPPILIELSHSEDGPGEHSGLLCSGMQTYAIVPLNAAHTAVLETLAQTDSSAESVLLVMTPDRLDIESDAGSFEHPSFVRRTPNDWIYRESIGVLDHLTIIGGGHVSVGLSRVVQPLGFRITVLDDRPELPTMAANRYADHLRVIDYAQVALEIGPGRRQYACIMTFAHASDERVLAALLRRPLTYLGMLGSVKKVARIRENLLRSGFTSAELDRVRAPIGVPIASQTPEEIGISIAAELIRVRNGLPPAIVPRELLSPGAAD